MKIAKTISYPMDMDREFRKVFGEEYGAANLVEALEDWLNKRDDFHKSPEELKKEIDQLENEWSKKVAILPVLIEKHNKDKIIKEQEDKIDKRNSYYKEILNKVKQLLGGKDKIEFINLKIKENRFPELKEELLRLKKVTERDYLFNGQ